MKELNYTPYVVLSAFLLAFGCAFPADPPQKVTQTPPPTVTDTTLLPLRSDVGWLYYVHPQKSEPVDYFTQAVKVSIANSDYYRVLYNFIDYSIQFRANYAIPILMQNVANGLAMYTPTPTMEDTTRDSPPPKLQYILPFPATVGMKWNDPDPFGSGYRVQVIAKDTAVKDYNGKIRKVLRYDVFDKAQTPTSIYVLPHKAIIKIEKPNGFILSIAWVGILDD